MAASQGDASLENQAASGIIEKRLARGGRMKEAGFFAVMVDSNLHSRNGCSCLPQVSFHPSFGHALRLDEPYLSREQSLAVRHELFQLSKSRAGAGAAGMKEKHQMVLTWSRVSLAGFGPLRRGGASGTGGLGILRHQQASHAHHQQPDHGRDCADFQ